MSKAELEQEIERLKRENTRWESLYTTQVLWMDFHSREHDNDLSQLKIDWEQVLQDRIRELEEALERMLRRQAGIRVSTRTS
ncbi:hypothetical protein LCGC14_1284400 [marine sediment metagenome]|uniref:Uncharacterized protein n=1 Tax=marine sediment metagenome TaxID=412755 RepID=A0A0F9KU96_9ZZZZ